MSSAGFDADRQPIAGPLGSLALSVVRPGASTLALRALRWHRDLERLGIVVPLFVVHDLGLLFAAAREQYALGARVPAALVVGSAAEPAELCLSYLQLVEQLGQCQAASRARELRLSDDMIVVVLARLLALPSQRLLARPPYSPEVPADASLFEQLEPKLPRLFRLLDREFELRTLAALRQSRLHLLTMADALDLDTLRLLGVLGTEAGAGAALQVDLLATMASPAAHEVVNFSLEILPSVLETKSRPGASSRAGFGCAGLSRRGSLDNVVLTEIAWDADDFARRYCDNELLFYEREIEREPAGRRHLLLIDASASMRGERQVFARGMALATGKKLLIEREDVLFRFFDSRLYEQHRARGGNLPTPYILSFSGERGRNPRRVFSELAAALEIQRARDHREVIIHVFTHAALYVPRELIADVRRLAKLAMVFILPSGGKLDLDYVDMLDAHWVVDHATLAEHGARARRARAILGQIGRGPEGGASP